MVTVEIAIFLRQSFHSWLFNPQRVQPLSARRLSTTSCDMPSCACFQSVCSLGALLPLFSGLLPLDPLVPELRFSLVFQGLSFFGFLFERSFSLGRSRFPSELSLLFLPPRRWKASSCIPWY